jgi:chromosome transmission fidelity protein 4
MLLEYKRGNLCDELMMDDITKREMVVDKELIRLIQMACKLLHHTASFDMAVRVADFYHLVGLREQLQILKADREVDKSRQLLKPPFPPSIDSFTITDSSNDFAKPSAGYRPGPIRATPSVESTYCSTTSNAAESASPQIETISAGISTSPEAKRKRSEDVGPDDGSKRQELEHKSTRT